MTFEEATLGFENHPQVQYFKELYAKDNFRPQVVVCAANRDESTGLLICGPRHWDRVMRAQADAIFPKEEFDRKTKKLRFEDQGFIDQYGNFLTREQAKIIALRMGQVILNRDKGDKELYSEELY